MGLTNHHVAFGKKRLTGFPIADKANTGTSYACLQPAPIDLKGRVKQLESDRDIFIKTQDKKGLTDDQKSRVLSPDRHCRGRLGR
jgi:hypothetical protein